MLSEPPVAPIFISYRRDDASGHARAVEQALARHFGADRVFIDVDDIVAGEAFDQRLRIAVVGASVVLVLIGRRWRGERPDRPDLPPRLFDAGDFVHREVATALAAGMPVLPLLLDDAQMPSPADLPADLQALTGRHALALDHRRFAADIERLVKALQAWVPLAAATSPPAGSTLAAVLSHDAGDSTAAPAGFTRRSAAFGLGIAALAGGVGWLLVRFRAPSEESRAGINGTWIAEVPYAWLPDPKRERFVFSGEGPRISGTASFLGVDRLVQEGKFEPATGLRFEVHTRESLGSESREVRHLYLGVPQADGIHFEMQTEGASQPHAPLRFVARRAPPATPAAMASGGG